MMVAIQQSHKWWFAWTIPWWWWSVMAANLLESTQLSANISFELRPMARHLILQKMVNDIRRKHSMAAIHQCYHGQFAGHDVNMFHPGKTIKHTVETYLSVYSKMTAKLNAKELPKRTLFVQQALEVILKEVKHCLRLPAHERYQLGLTSLSLLSRSEYRKRLDPHLHERIKMLPVDRGSLRYWKGPVPATLDWRKKKAVTPIKDQKDCGSCFIFGTMVSIEGAYMIKKKVSPDKASFSEQAVLNCLGRPGVCIMGGLPGDVYNICKEKGVTTTKQVPYVGKQENCGDYKYLFKISKFSVKKHLPDNAIKKFIAANGPAVIGMDASAKAFSAVTDIYNPKKCGNEIDHAVAIVGWDTKYWIIKNSWGKQWGKGGYFRLPFGKNLCNYRSLFGQAVIMGKHGIY